MYAMREGETDLAFAELGGPGRAYTAPAFDRNFARPRNPFFQLVGRLRLEPRTNGLKDPEDGEGRRVLAASALRAGA